MDDLMAALDGLLPAHVMSWVVVAVAVCAALAVALPAPAENGGSKAYAAFYRLVQWIGLNLGKARNAQDVRPKNDGTKSGHGQS